MLSHPCLSMILDTICVYRSFLSSYIHVYGVLSQRIAIDWVHQQWLLSLETHSRCSTAYQSA